MLVKEDLLEKCDLACKELRILQVSTSDIAGGAARAAYRLHTALLKQAHNSTMLVARRNSGDPSVKLFTGSPIPYIRMHRVWRRLLISGQSLRYNLGKSNKFEIFTDDRTMYGASLLEKIPPCDIINLHWIATFVDYRAFFKNISANIKIVWTLHDMNPFTGGCHYDNGCGKFVTGCEACPQLGSNKRNDLSRQIWKRKYDAFSQISPERLHIVTPSYWLAMEVKRSFLLGSYPVTVIPNGVDGEAFIPFDRGFARNALGIPEDSKVVLFLADLITSKRKGFTFLLQTFDFLKNIPDIFLLSVGSGTLTIDANIPWLHLGEISNDRLLSLAYSSADVFVVPSIQDNLPNTILESFACGTPVVGFSIGGIPELVHPGETGDLAQPFDVKDLSNKISNLLLNSELCRSIGENCRQFVTNNYSLEKQAERYMQLYRQITQ
ncbi:MAG: glycosyltransferase family 4 protein [Paenibacillus sp.]|nr:glycosyltransferase family 4 protein [Paenibacillus sp.]